MNEKIEENGYVRTNASSGVIVWQRRFVVFDVVENRVCSVCFRCGKEPLRFGKGDENFVDFRREILASGRARGEKGVVGLGNLNERELGEQRLPIVGLVGVGIGRLSKKGGEVQITRKVAECG